MLVTSTSTGEGVAVGHIGDQLLIVGLSHRRASVADLERAAVHREALPRVLSGLRSTGFDEAVVLSTCSRTEIYTTAGEDGAARVACGLRAIAGWSGLPRDRVTETAEVQRGTQAVAHLFRVTAGLESRLVGDVDVLAQVRQAWRAADEAGTTGPTVDRLFRESLRCAQQVHSRTALGRQGRSLARRAVDVGLGLARCSAEPDVLVVGSGQMARVACEHLSAVGQPFRVVARDPIYAARLAGPDRSGPITRLVEEVRSADVVLCATSAPHHVLRREHVDDAMVGRDRPLIIVDLTVPRNVEPCVAHVGGVRLVELGDLGDDARREPAVAAVVETATLAVEESARRLCDDLASASAAPVIKAVRARVEETCSYELRRHAHADDPEVHTRTVHAIVGKVMHSPTMLARAAAAAGDRTALILLCEAFGVTADDVLPPPDLLPLPGTT